MNLLKQGLKPSGFIGRIIGHMMNRYHTKFYIHYFSSKLPQENAKILDIGCGGGKFIKFLSEANQGFTIYGLDHSPEMIQLSIKKNQKAIAEKKVKIIKASVVDIPLESNSLDLVTAFETIHFWPDTIKALIEVHRTLKPGGQFIIINIYPKKGTKWYKFAKIKNDREYEELLQESGFNHIVTDLISRRGWIIVTSQKQ